MELAHVILMASKLPDGIPQLLMQPISAYTTSIKDKPRTVSGVVRDETERLVRIFLQGQNIALKILPKSKRHAYVGYNDACKSVLYCEDTLVSLKQITD